VNEIKYFLLHLYFH